MKHSKGMMIGTGLGVALLLPMGAHAESDKFCNQAPSAAETVTFGAGTNNHQLDPNEVTITVGGTVTFDVEGPGHRIAIYPVSRTTQRKDISEDLNPNCVDLVSTDPETSCGTASRYLVTDGKGQLTIDTTPVNPPFPISNLVEYEVGRLTYTGDAAVDPLGPNIAYRFRKPGKYLVICANRNHLNDVAAGHMFGFVNVVDCSR